MLWKAESATLAVFLLHLGFLPPPVDTGKCIAGYRTIGFIRLLQSQNNCLKTHADRKHCVSHEGPTKGVKHSWARQMVSC